MSEIRERWTPQGLAGRQIDSGTLAARPAFGVADRYYWATDIFMLFRDTGAAWEVAGGTPYRRWLSNLPFLGPSGPNNRAFGTIGRVFLTEIQIPFTLTIDLLGYVTGTAVAGNVRVGLYERGAVGWPDLPDGGDLVVETGSFAQGVGTRMPSFGAIADTQLTPGSYYLGVQGDDIAGAYYSVNSRLRAHETLGNAQVGFRYDHGYGVFTDPCPVTTDDYPPFVYLRVASIP